MNFSTDFDHIYVPAYTIDEDVLSYLLGKIEKLQKENMYLGMQIEKLSNMTIHSIFKEPKIINIEHHIYNLRMAANCFVNSYNNKMHVICKINGEIDYGYYLDEELFNNSNLNTKKIMLIEMHKKLIIEILDIEEKKEEEKCQKISKE